MIMHPEVDEAIYVIGYRIMRYPQNKDEALTPMALAERWIARLAVRAIVARKKKQNAPSATAASVAVKRADSSAKGVEPCLSNRSSARST